MPHLLYPRDQTLHAYTFPDASPRASTPDRAPPAPAPTSTLQRRASLRITEINGSPTGFIALVVALCLITVFASLGAFLLARVKPLPRLRLPFRRASAFSSPHPLDHDHIRPGPDTMRARLARIFGRRPDGWVRVDANAWSTDTDVEEFALAAALTCERSPPSSTTGVPTFAFAHGARHASRLASRRTRSKLNSCTRHTT
ncbi:hypothetical protein CERSUDRAFT_100112 [Gelatoporia subvermispora B]|uniref:Uncharacterized protein n=1 Tax=Ceriporiopsis subvermispora (strain B) TaxID=914234 RepID=M2P8E1_CERS8|nr:hypothetical protein CERSUDRAFT_100112 [Gelatoporia subvermispora B]